MMLKLWFRHRIPRSVLIDEGLTREEIRQYRTWENTHNKALFKQFIVAIVMVGMNILVPTEASFFIVPLCIMCIKGAIYDDEVIID